jgi:hypothetical protein
MPDKRLKFDMKTAAGAEKNAPTVTNVPRTVNPNKTQRTLKAVLGAKNSGRIKIETNATAITKLIGGDET